jgi:outer membrane receptor protein involved in Fe transport
MDGNDLRDYAQSNLEKIFAILKAIGQVVVFVDEADQAAGKRGGGDSDSGLSGRVYAMLAKEMSDTRNRGRIIWVFATSRPDLLEVDLKRQGIAPVVYMARAYGLETGTRARNTLERLEAAVKGGRMGENVFGTVAEAYRFLLGLRSSYTIISPFIFNLRQRMHFLYAQNDWKVDPKLTVNLGLRYEYES